MQVALWPQPGPWPFIGAFGGEREGLSWVGRTHASIEQESDLDRAWQRACSVSRTIAACDGPTAAHRLAAAWDALRRIDGAGRLTVLFTAVDGPRVAVSACGVRCLTLVSEAGPRPFVAEGHPLLGPPGVPDLRPGALTVDAGSGSLVASAGPLPEMGPGQLLGHCVVST